VALTISYEVRSRMARDSGLTQLIAEEPLTVFTGAVAIAEGRGEVINLAGGATNQVINFSGITSLRFLLIIPVSTPVIMREVVGDTGIRIATGKPYLCEYDSGGAPPAALLLTNTDAMTATDVLIHMAGT